MPKKKKLTEQQELDVLNKAFDAEFDKAFQELYKKLNASPIISAQSTRGGILLGHTLGLTEADAQKFKQEAAKVQNKTSGLSARERLMVQEMQVHVAQVALTRLSSTHAPRLQSDSRKENP